MEYYGYAGKVLYVDLTTGDIKKEPLEPEFVRKFIGGMGINYRLAYDHLKLSTAPLSPGNPIIIGAGPLCGTLTPGGAKVAVTYKRPVEGSRKEEKHPIASAIGGSKRFGHMLKCAGYDHVVITGKAAQPSYLKIINDDIEICDANDLWMKRDLYETTEELMKRHRGASGGCGVWAIGRAGENMVKWAHAIVDKRGSLGRWGGGAVLGSKNIKAVVTLGTKGIKLADPKRFMDLIRQKGKEIQANPTFHEAYPPGGGGAISEAFPLEAYYETKRSPNACMSCMRPEFNCHVIQDGRFAGEGIQGTYYATIRDYGRRLRLKDYREMYKFVDVCNRYGLDFITSSKMLYFVTKLYERGIISLKDTGGLKLERGDIDCYLKLMEKIINREDIGWFMAEGWYPLIERVGVDASDDLKDGAFIIKGQDGIMDGLFAGITPGVFSEVVRAKPLHVHQATHYNAGSDIYQNTYWPEDRRSFYDAKRDFVERMAPTNEEIERTFTEKDFHTSRLAKHAEDVNAIMNSLGVCDLSPYGIWDPPRDLPFMAEVYSAITGIEITPGQLKVIGERVWNLEKLLMVREGFSREDDAFPGIWLQNVETSVPLRSGDRYLSNWFRRRLTRDDLHKMLDDYYEERGWDLETSIPTKGKLAELGLEEFTEIVDTASKK